MAASPLSRSIQQLEHDLGGPLFDRGTRRVELTPPGAGLVPRARKLLDEVDDITRSVRLVQACGQQDILLGTRSVPATLIRVMTAEVIAEASPAAQVRLQPMESIAQLDEILRGPDGTGTGVPAGARASVGVATRSCRRHRRSHSRTVSRSAPCSTRLPAGPDRAVSPLVSLKAGSCSEARPSPTSTR